MLRVMITKGQFIEDILDGMNRYTYYNHPQSNIGEIFGEYNYGMIYGLYYGGHSVCSEKEVDYDRLMDGETDRYINGLKIGLEISNSVKE